MNELDTMSTEDIINHVTKRFDGVMFCGIRPGKVKGGEYVMTFNGRADLVASCIAHAGEKLLTIIEKKS